MGGEAWSDASETIDKIRIESTLYVNGTQSASDEDYREDDDHAETKVTQTWTNPWYEVSYESEHTFKNYTHHWTTLVLKTRPRYASKGQNP
jgi:hypothetical protein